jgi:hypothetical protein
MGHFLLGPADMLRIMVDDLAERGNQLVARAQAKPNQTEKVR